MNWKEAIKEAKNLSLAQKFTTWKEKLKELQGPQIIACLEAFVVSFPFNCEQWAILARMIEALNGEKEARVVWEKAVKMNPKSVWLWKYYLLWASERGDSQEMQKVLAKALKECGYDFDSDWIYHYYVNSQTKPERLFNFYLQALSKPSRRNSTLYQGFQNWFKSIGPVELQQIWRTHRKEPFLDYQKSRSLIEEDVSSRHRRAREISQTRLKYEDGLGQSEYFPNQLYDTWNEYLVLVREKGDKEDTLYHFQKAMITQCDKVQFWQQYIGFLEEEYPDGQKRLLEQLRRLSVFLLNVDFEVSYRLAELEEKEGHFANAREVYLCLEKHSPQLECFARHIHMELRAKQTQHAKSLFDVALSIFGNNADLVTEILLEYATFVKRQLRDHQFAKKLIKNYLEAIPFKERLFVSGIQIIATSDLKEGSREQKELMAEIMQIVETGMRKAFAELPGRNYEDLSRRMKYLLRGLFPSIYSIKLNQRKIHQIERASNSLTSATEYKDQSRGSVTAITKASRLNNPRHMKSSNQKSSSSSCSTTGLIRGLPFPLSRYLKPNILISLSSPRLFLPLNSGSSMKLSSPNSFPSTRISLLTYTAVSVASCTSPKWAQLGITSRRHFVRSRGGWSPSMPPNTKALKVEECPVESTYFPRRSSRQTSFLGIYKPAALSTSPSNSQESGLSSMKQEAGLISLSRVRLAVFQSWCLGLADLKLSTCLKLVRRSRTGACSMTLSTREYSSIHQLQRQSSRCSMMNSMLDMEFEQVLSDMKIDINREINNLLKTNEALSEVLCSSVAEFRHSSLNYFAVYSSVVNKCLELKEKLGRLKALKAGVQSLKAQAVRKLQAEKNNLIRVRLLNMDKIKHDQTEHKEAVNVNADDMQKILQNALSQFDLHQALENQSRASAVAEQPQKGPADLEAMLDNLMGMGQTIQEQVTQGEKFKEQQQLQEEQVQPCAGQQLLEKYLNLQTQNAKKIADQVEPREQESKKEQKEEADPQQEEQKKSEEEFKAASQISD